MGTEEGNGLQQLPPNQPARCLEAGEVLRLGARTAGQTWDFPTHSFSHGPGPEGREPGPSGGGETSLASDSGKKQLLCELQSVTRTRFSWSPGVSSRTETGSEESRTRTLFPPPCSPGERKRGPSKKHRQALPIIRKMLSVEGSVTQELSHEEAMI